jgi:NAD(P)-dependent dehydrogenase (short-subunit alcohol dehydrogenase family)
MGRLDGKIAVITGAASGIGRGTALRVAAEGARTVVADLDAAGAKRVADEIASAGGEASVVQVDMGENDSVREMVRAAVSTYGGLDILHNNAAATRLAATRDLPVSTADPDVWDETMRVNLRGAMVAIQAAVPHMIARGGGSVINTASGAGLTGDLRNPAYGASKAALVSLTRYVATEFGRQGIRCNAISPGFIVIPEKPGRAAVEATMLRHQLTPRLGRPEDIAALVVFLASDEAAYITGQNICVDGGMLAHQPFVADFQTHLSERTGVSPHDRWIVRRARRRHHRRGERDRPGACPGVRCPGGQGRGQRPRRRPRRRGVLRGAGPRCRR